MQEFLSVKLSVVPYVKVPVKMHQLGLESDEM